MNHLALLPRLCRTCGKSSREVSFPTMSKHLCTACKDGARTARAERIEARGPRVADAVREDAGSSPKHLAWVRKLPCAVRSTQCSGPVQAHHVRSAATAGTGMKPPDSACVPLCAGHHAEGHQRGWITFEDDYAISLRNLATKLAAASPHLKGHP